MPNLTDRGQAALDALKSGGTVSTVDSSELSSNGPEVKIEEPSFSMDADYGERDLEANEGEEESNEESETAVESEETEETEVDDSEEEEQPEDIEYIQADGKRIKVDYSDRERIKKVHQMAAGMRKFQSERDTAIKERDEIKPKYEELKSLFSKADSFIGENDDDGLFRLITGGRELEDIVTAREQERGKMSKMSQEEIDAYTEKKATDKRTADLNKREAVLKKREEDADAKLNTSEKTRQQTMVETAFNKYRFAGQLGDDAQAKSNEDFIDSTMWNNAIKALEGYEEVDLELIETVMKENAERLRSMINVQATKKANSQINKTKKTAKKEVQSAVFDKNSQKKKELQDMVRSGDMVGSLTSFLGGGFNL